MIPKAPDNIFETNIEGLKTIKFTFQTDRHIFDSFSKNLYSKPEESTVREIISNALDAHSRVNKSNDPITIILTDTEFIVEDYGPGITSEHMENVVGVYGKSDKRDTNNELGMYGFGFKAPFSISDQFTVETVCKNGYKSIWIIYKDLSGHGELKLISQIKTNDPTGTKVRVPIKKNILYSIQNSIIKFIDFLTPVPITHFPKNYIHQKINISKESKNWIYIENPKFNNIIVLYDGWMIYELPYTVKYLKNLVIKLHKGEIDLSPSRESIKITEELKNIIDKRKEEYIEEISKEFKQNIVKLNVAEDVIRCMQKHCTYCSVNLDSNIEININHPKYGDISYPINNDSCLLEYGVYYTGGTYRIKNRFKKLLLSTLINEKDSLKLLYIEDAEFDKIYSSYYCRKFKHIYKTQKNIAIINKSTIDRNYNKLINEYIKSAIDIKSIKLPTSFSSSGIKRKYKKDHIIGYSENNQRLELPIKGKTYVYCENKWELSEYSQLSSDKNIQLCKIHKKAINKIKDLPNWLRPKEYINKEISTIDSKSLEDILYNKALDRSHSVVKFFNKKRINHLNDKQNSLLNLAINKGIVAQKQKIEENIKKDFYKKYPLLEYINFNNDKKLKDDIEQYIKLMEQS